MSTSRITINGQSYDSPDAMPPDVRRLYDEAMRSVGPALAGGTGTDVTQVVSGSGGLGVKSNIVIRKTITVNNKTYKNVDEMPPEVRQLFQSGIQQAQGTMAVAPGSGLHVNVNLGRPEVRTVFNPGGATPGPIEPGSMQPGARRFLTTLIFWVVVGLLVFAFLESLTLHIHLK